MTTGTDNKEDGSKWRMLHGEAVTDALIKWGVEEIWPMPKSSSTVEVYLVRVGTHRWRVVHYDRVSDTLTMASVAYEVIAPCGELAEGHYHLALARTEHERAKKHLAETEFRLQECINKVNQLTLKHAQAPV